MSQEPHVQEFLSHGSRPLGPKAPQGVDIEDFGKKFNYIEQNHHTPAEHYNMHPKVKHYAPARTTQQYEKDKDFWKRFNHPHPKDLVGDFTNCNATLLDERSALLEAARCLKCVDAPCVSACPSSVDVPAFIQAIENQNYALAAKIILSANSNGLSCGNICATSDLCSGSCTLATPHSKGINIEGLQKFALDKFAQMQIAPTLDTTALSTAPAKDIALRTTPIAVIGAGPAGLAVATFMARLGYNNITIFEKEKAAGGINTFELPEFRLPHVDVQYEVQLLETLGVKFVYDKKFVVDVVDVAKELSFASLKAQGFNHIFLGFGRPNPIVLPEFKHLSPKNGVYNSKEFLPLTTIASKPALTALYAAENLPQLDFTGKRVIVLGGGDVAVDAATSSIRLGSTNVSIVFRKNTADMRCMIEERHHAESEHIDFIPYCLPKQVLLHEHTQQVKSMEFFKQSKDMSGNYVTDEDEFIRLKADIIITAFGCKAAGCDVLIPGLKTRRDGCVDVDAYGRTNISGVFAGGDLTGASTTVGASNDGKVAAWAMHLAIVGEDKDEEKLKNIELPNFHTPIDDVDVSVVVDGVLYPNPFVLASAPPCTSYEMIDRAFATGWGGAVVKTFTLDKDMATNVSGRITTSTQGTEDVANSKRSWFNIELVTEKSAEYWYSTMSKLKQRHPQHVVISSIMCTFNEADWTELATKSIIIGNCDALELNLSCPHMGTKENPIAMEIGQNSNGIQQVISWVVAAVRSTSRPNVPIYIKLTPNVTNIVDLAIAANRGLQNTPNGIPHPGGVTAINTVSGLVGYKFDTSPLRHGVPLVEDEDKLGSPSGGYCGAGIRPLALKAVSAIHKAVPNGTILATGGIDSANVALQMIYAGASILQVCSAVMNRDYSVINDFVYGLKALFYIKQQQQSGTGKFVGWQYQSPAFGSADETKVAKTLLKFGHFQKQQLAEKKIAHQKQTAEKVTKWKINTAVEDDHTLKMSLPQLSEGVPTKKTTAKTSNITDNIGQSSATYISPPDMSRFRQTVALINDDDCLLCGRCYASCNDNAYQAIKMDPVTRRVEVLEDKCTSCGICESVCPALNCITFVPRKDTVLTSYRGTDVKNEVLKEYPAGHLTPEQLLKPATTNNNTGGCGAKTCCGGSCQSSDEIIAKAE